MSKLDTRISVTCRRILQR